MHLLYTNLSVSKFTKQIVNNIGISQFYGLFNLVFTSHYCFYCIISCGGRGRGVRVLHNHSQIGQNGRILVCLEI